MGQRCESEPPYLKPSNAWGLRESDLITSSGKAIIKKNFNFYINIYIKIVLDIAWKSQKTVAAEEGLVAIAYEGKFGAYDRIYQAAKLMLYAPASGLYSCPLVSDALMQICICAFHISILFKVYSYYAFKNCLIFRQ